MRSFFKLFARSPYGPLREHMEEVARCVHMLPQLFARVTSGDFNGVEAIAIAIAEAEHEADLLKNDIRNKMPKGLFFSIDRRMLLEILSLQDSIADNSEDVAVMVTLKQLELPQGIDSLLTPFLQKNIEAFDEVRCIVKEFHELSESSFGGLEAENVKVMVDRVCYKEHEADLLQQKLLKFLFSLDSSLSVATFYQWQQIIHALAAIANLSEKLANRVRMTLELS